VAPVLERHRREHPEARARRTSGGDLDGILAELGAIRAVLLGGEPLSDVQLFSQLRNLQDIRAALQAVGTETAQSMASEVDKLLEGVFESSKWSG
jgi:MoxR-like ATPase